MAIEEFQAALRRALNDSGRTQSWLGAEAARAEGRADPYSQAVVSSWFNDPSPGLSPRQVFAIEEALGVEPGMLSRLLGYLPASAKSVVATPDAIAADPDLSPVGRRVLLAAYQELVDHGADRR